MLVKTGNSYYNEYGRVRMKKHSGLKVVLITILVLALLTWILPVAVYQGSYVDQGRSQVGLFNLFSYPIATVTYFGYIGAFIILIGGFYGVLSKTGVYRTLLDKIVRKFKGKELWVLGILMVLLAVATSICGLSLALMVFFPFIISLILLMGYNKLVAASVTVGSVMIGTMGTTFAASTVDLLNQTLGLTVQSEIITKVVILLIGLILLIFNTLWYAKKVKGAVSEKKEEFIPEKTTSKRKVWPLIVVLDLIFVLMVLGMTTWNEAFNLDIFDTATEAVTTFEIGGFAIFGKLLGSAVPAFGYWSIYEIMITLAVASIVIALIYRVKINDFISGFIAGAKRAFGPAVLMVLIYTCLILASSHPFQLVIAHFLIGLTKSFNVVTTTIVAILTSLFNVDLSYGVSYIVPYVTSVVTDTSLYPLIAIIFQTIYGFVMLVAPTSVILMGTLAYLRIPYQDWLKYIWKLLLQLIVVLFIIFTIIMLV